jgi:Flp pilus assembly protein TadD
MQGRSEEAVEAYARVLSLDPRNARVWVNVAGIHHRADRLEEAQHAYEQAIEHDTEGFASPRYWLAMLHTRLEDDVAAIQRLRECIEVAPEEHRCHCALGQVLARSEAFEEARAAYTAALELQHDCARSLGGLVGVLNELGRVDDAARQLHQLSASAPDAAQRVEDALARGDWREALDQACEGETR